MAKTQTPSPYEQAHPHYVKKLGRLMVLFIGGGFLLAVACDSWMTIKGYRGPWYLGRDSFGHMANTNISPFVFFLILGLLLTTLAALLMDWRGTWQRARTAPKPFIGTVVAIAVMIGLLVLFGPDIWHFLSQVA
ncbi:hypothetical protein [Lacticaseibacillus mingshuiensis]|uniref:Uncharacterized protein n=1 Tax=Lacticaseibacillus mingshuiensis TaxID=2799574 RepID=A0ABW4CHZ7_9LACO|nr:hypothetical protein [Lacticaseibacillus mingshuiensis]